MEDDSKWPVVGHENIINFLEKSIKAGKLSHAYLFAGSSNLGKTLVADYFIRSMLCEESENKPCNKCQTCKNFKKGLYSDFYHVKREEDSKNINIEQIRNVIKSIESTSFSGNYKIILIENVESLNLSSANSLLKSLEEPSKKTIFILIADNINMVPETIRSRSQVINFYPVEGEKMLDRLLLTGINKDIAKEAIAISGGKPGIAFKYASNSVLMKKYKDVVGSFLGLLDSSVIDRLNYADNILGKKNTFGQKITIVDDVLDIWLYVFRDLLFAKNYCFSQINNIFVIDKINKLSDNYTDKAILDFIDKIKEAKENIRNNVNPQLILETLLLKF